MDEPIRVQDAVVIRVEHFLLRGLGHLDRLAHRRKFLKFGRIAGVVGRSVAGIRMQDHEDFIGRAGEDVLLQTRQQDAVEPLIGLGMHRLEIGLFPILFDVYRRLAPVAGAPRYIYAVPVQVVGQDFVQFLGVARLQDAPDARHGVGGRGIREQDRYAVLGGVGVGFPVVSVLGEMVPPGRFPDDEHAHIAAFGDGHRVFQRNFFHIAAAFGAEKAEGIHGIGPRHEHAAQLGSVPIHPGPVGDVAEYQQGHRTQGDSDASQGFLRPVVVHFPGKEVDAGQDAQHQDVAHQGPGEETGGFGILGVEDIAHHVVRYQHVEIADKIEHDGVAHQGEGDDAFSYETAQGQDQVIGKEIAGDHQQDHAGNNERAVQAGFNHTQQVPVEGSVEGHQRIEAQHQAEGRERDILFKQFHFQNRILWNRTISPIASASSSRLKRMVSGMLTCCGVPSYGVVDTEASYRANGFV